MKEHFQDYGVRKWAGDDLIELQSEPLAALQALVEPYAPCIIQGCEVTENGNEGITVSPGLVALKGKDSKGNACVKIARFAGIESETSIYLTLACETVNRAYGDGKVKDIAYDYKAVASTQRPEESFLQISGKEVPRLVDTLGITQKLDRVGGDASQTKVDFSEANAEELKSGNPLSKLFGAIKNWLDGIKGKLDGITTKLNGIEAGAEVNVQADWDDNDNTSDAYIKNKPGNATPSTGGLMSSEDKIKLNGIAVDAEVNVQSDWNETNADNDAYIKNKPTASNIGGILPISNGGTGQTDPYAAARVLLYNIPENASELTDNSTLYVANHLTATVVYKKPLSLLWNWIKSKLATVATSGSYNDLTDKPTVDSALSSTSGNPVQNSVVTSSLDKKLSLSGGIMTGPIKHSISESTTDPYYISAGGGVGKNAGKYGLKLLSHDGNGQSGIGVDLTGYSYEMTIAASCSSSGTTHITFAKHTNTSTTYTRLAEIDGSGNFNAIGQIKENGTRVYSPNNKPTPGVIGAAAASHTHDYLPLAGGTITGNLRLKGSGNFGNKLNFGDNEYVYLHEPTDDSLEIYGANSINLKTNSGISTLKVNGTPIKDALPSATTSAAGLMSAADKKNLNDCLAFRIVGAYIVDTDFTIAHGFGLRVDSESYQSPTNPCCGVTLNLSYGFSANKTYMFIAGNGYEHTIETYGAFAHGGETFKLVYRRYDTRKPEMSGFAPYFFIVECNGQWK